ncbi:MAG TPA: hypothetical protein VES19_09240 [Candidatus Limnocylindrales bacterium]|nr:hypothetical protein [Candidatus Limnocylindrales bacterium]
MSSDPRAFVALDRGTATVAASLVARIDGRWRLLGATASPAGVEADAVVERLRRRLAAGEPELAELLGVIAPGSAADLPRVACMTSRPPEIAVVAATERVLAPLVAVAAAAGWRVRPLALDGAEILPVATALADPRVTAVLAGASDPPGADERSLLPDLGAVVASATDRRPDLVTVLAGGLAAPGSRVEAQFRPDRPGATVLGPSPVRDGGEPLRELLDGLRGGDHDGRRALAAGATTLAEVLRRRIEVVEIGQSGATRVVAGFTAGRALPTRWASVPAAALLPPAFTDAHLDAVAGWLTTPLDRLRLRDRLRELALVPWGDATGEGASLRLAAARAALGRLRAATPAMDEAPGPDVVIATGGAWAIAPGPAVGLALADVMRRPGVRALGWDHARLLAPLGAIEDESERRALMADLRDDLLLPLGSVVMPAGLRAGRAAGHLTVRGEGEPAELDLVPGGLELVDLPPGERAVVELRFREAVDLGVRVKHAAVEVTGGLGGLLVDLRDVPLRLPERPERRRDLLAAWQAALWAGMDA